MVPTIELDWEMFRDHWCRRYHARDGKLLCFLACNTPIPNRVDCKHATCPALVCALVPGLNPENLSADVLAKMPEGSRLLESEEERKAFAAKAMLHSDLYQRTPDGWINSCRGNGTCVTYATTRPRGWWKEGGAR